ncbi:hypothetical protein HMPREF9413_5382 [Paenibacillus sp. HGF7]|nr:hypothetical protein HMPREF9413_5382 [Paenibacillus sp. HGF7]
MSRPKARQKYIELHGNADHIDVMMKKRDGDYLKNVMDKGISKEDAEKC